MRLPDKPWPETDGARGVLFFAQQMREMLTPQTFESFRAMSLDTIARLKECRRVLLDFERGAITDATIVPFLSELGWSLENDPIVKAKQPLMAALYKDRLKDKKSTALALVPIIETLLKRLGAIYKQSLQEALLNAFPVQKRRSELKTLTSYYCSHLLNSGYSRSFILDSINEAFFDRAVARAGAATLQAFFKRFTEEKRTYLVYVMTDRRFAQPMVKMHVKSLKYADLSAQVQTAFAGNERLPTSRWMEFAVEAQDIYSAGDLNEFILNSVQAINFLGPQIDGYRWSKERYVTTPRASTGRMIVPPSAQGIPHRRAMRQQARPVDFANTLQTVLGQLDERSTTRLLNSLNTSDLSGRHITPETRLISLWSSIEILLSDPPKGTARIVHYEQNIVPCICLKYMRRNLVAVFDELRVTYKRKFIKIIKTEPDYDGKDNHSRFAAIMMLEKNKPIRDALLVLAAKNPLALYRLYRLWKECSQPKAFRKAVEDHEKRVRWQLYRIYRARNTLVHAGQSPTYLWSLVQNVAEYYKSSVWTVLSHVRGEQGRSSLADAVGEIGVEYEMLKSRLNDMATRQSFTAEEMLFLMHVR